MNILRVRCQNAEDFREHYKNDQPNGGLFCPTTTELDPGTPVVVEVVCKALPNRVLIRGTVVSWRPALPRLRVRAGAVVSFDADEAPKRDFILETLGGQRKPTPKRRHTRIPLGWPAHLKVGAELSATEAELREISVSGALVACSVQPSIETDVVLQVSAAGRDGAHGHLGSRALPRGPRHDGDQVPLPRGRWLAPPARARPSLQGVLKARRGARGPPRARPEGNFRLRSGGESRYNRAAMNDPARAVADSGTGAFPPGTLLGGRFRIKELIRAEGETQVYRASDAHSGSEVALQDGVPLGGRPRGARARPGQGAAGRRTRT